MSTRSVRLLGLSDRMVHQSPVMIGGGGMDSTVAVFHYGIVPMSEHENDTDQKPFKPQFTAEVKHGKTSIRIRDYAGHAWRIVVVGGSAWLILQLAKLFTGK